MPAPNLWQQVHGMAAEKSLIERRIVLPLSHAALAEEHGVRAPRAVMLFGSAWVSEPAPGAHHGTRNPRGVEPMTSSSRP